jgi:hypothetical protein
MLEPAGMELMGEHVHIGQDFPIFLYQVLDFGTSFGFGLRHLFPNLREGYPLKRQTLSEVIVKFSRDASTLLFLGGDQAAAQLLESLL